MSKVDELRALAARCEAATVASADLDCAIAGVVDVMPWKLYTRSLDAALSLVDDRCKWWQVSLDFAHDSPMLGFGGNKRPFQARVGLNWGDPGLRGQGSTPALALCAAALRARAEAAAGG